LRILVLQESDWLARGPHQNHHLMERMAARGHEIRVLDFEIGWSDRSAESRLQGRQVFPNVHKVLERGRVTVIRPGFLRVPFLDLVSSLVTHAVEIRRQFREFKPDVVVGFGILNTFLGILSARRHRIPFVQYVIDELHRLIPWRAFQGLGRIVEQADLRRATMVFSINEGLRDYTIRMGAPPSRAKLLRAGIDLDRYLAVDGSMVRRRYGITNDDILLFFMGWLYRFSGLTKVAETIVAAPAETSNCKLLVIGKGELWQDLRELTSQDDSSQRVIIEPWRPYEELPSYLAAADICILPALNVEVMKNIVPIKMYEYMAAGKPVLATALPGLVREFGEGHGVVYLRGPEEVVPMALELVRRGALEQLGRQARAFVEGSDWTKVIDSFEAYLTDAVRNGDFDASKGL